MSKRTQNLLDGKLAGSFSGLAAVTLSFGLALALAAAGGMVLAGCDTPAGAGSSYDAASADDDSKVNIGDIGKTDPKDVNYAEESALAFNKGGKDGKGKGKGPAGWIPRKESALVGLQAVWSQTLSDPAKQAAFGWPADECAVVTDAIDAFTAALNAYNADKTKENRGAKDEAKKASVKAMLDFAKARIFRNELLSQEDKASLGLKPRDKDPRDKQPRDKAGAPEAGVSAAEDAHGLALTSVAGTEDGESEAGEESALALNKGGQGPADWIPGMEAKLVKLQSKWSQILSDTAKQAAFDWPADECAVVTDAIDAFTAAREAYSADKTKENRGAKEKAKKASVKAMRDFDKARVEGNDLMSVKDKLALGILFDR